MRCAGGSWKFRVYPIPLDKKGRMSILLRFRETLIVLQGDGLDGRSDDLVSHDQLLDQIPVGYIPMCLMHTLMPKGKGSSKSSIQNRVSIQF